MFSNYSSYNLTMGKYILGRCEVELKTFIDGVGVNLDDVVGGSSIAGTN